MVVRHFSLGVTEWFEGWHPKTKRSAAIGLALSTATWTILGFVSGDPYSLV